MDDSTWRERLAAPRYLGARVAKADRDRGLLCRQSRDDVQYVTWDVPSGATMPTGITGDGYLDSSWLSADGRALFHLVDSHGDELGEVHRTSLDDPSDSVPIGIDGVEGRYTLRGGDASADGSVIVFSPINAAGFTLAIASAEANAAGRIVHRTRHEAWNPLVSADGALATMDTTDHNPGVRRYAVSAFDTATGGPVGVLTGDNGAKGCRFAPTGDRLLVNRTMGARGFTRPVIWAPRSGELTPVPTPWDDDEVEIIAFDWSPDSQRILLVVQHLADQHLALHDVSTGDTTPLDLPPVGYWRPDMCEPTFAADGTVLATAEAADTPLTVLRWSPDEPLQTVLAPLPAAPSRPSRSVTFASTDGTTIQAWLLTPDGAGPFPTVVQMHGGPHWFAADRYEPETQAWLDHGFALLDVNFRGSTGRGSAFAEQIWGHLGELELTDLAAAREFLVTNGIARADATYLAGASYGAFLTLYALGRQPQLWAGGFAVVALVDWTMAYEDASAALRAAMRQWFGGSPAEVPERYRDSSPITYCQQISAPVLVQQGRYDSRTTPRQMLAFERRMRELGKDLRIDWFDAGHGLGGSELSERRLDLAFATAHH